MAGRGPLRAAVAALPLRGDSSTARDGTIVRDAIVPGEPPRTFLVRIHDGVAHFVRFAPQLRKETDR
ncbi:hypothetical protein [Methylobacterium sp. WL7]|uniref:hypothetical protein n=1 Tax=Methylobacterium sp. WL7 TaxID=2603900 RepID=UPI0011C81669|nr:hypothetical protein [Methylobacterium sp. WL7]TXN47416.1 hypothetical protein FV233_05155 [Methylobacterium sp. WL7]